MISPLIHKIFLSINIFFCFCTLSYILLIISFFSFTSKDDNKLNNKNTFRSNVKVSTVWPVTQNTHYVINANCTEIFGFATHQNEQIKLYFRSFSSWYTISLCLNVQSEFHVSLFKHTLILMKISWNGIKFLFFFFLFVQMFRIASAIELNCTHSNNICLPCHMKNRTSKWPWSSESVLYAGAKHRIHIQAPKFTKWWLQYNHTTITVLLCVELYAQLSITQNSALHKHSSYAIHISYIYSRSHLHTLAKHTVKGKFLNQNEAIA